MEENKVIEIAIAGVVSAGLLALTVRGMCLGIVIVYHWFK